LKLTDEETTWLQRLSQSRSEAAGQVQRAEILLRYHGGETVSRIAAALRMNWPRVERCIAKALELGARGALQDLPGRGRHPTLTAEARAWVVALACQNPKELGYAQEVWTTSLLARHVRQQGGAAGHASLQHLARGTVPKILGAQPVQPHQIEYYRERRDAAFDAKMKQVLHVYRHVELWHSAGAPGELTAVLSYDEKPGIQALDNTAPDLPPVPGRHATVGRDHEYVRHGTLSLLAGLDLWNGEVLGFGAGAPPECRVHRISALARRPVSDRGPHSPSSGPSLRAYFPGNPHLLGHPAQPIRIHLHTHPWFLAESDRIVLCKKWPGLCCGEYG
jgi:hypothetical protein